MDTDANYKRGVLIMFMFGISFIQINEARCNTSIRFGPDCGFTCHCMKNEQCDFTTGKCPSGCDFAWVGPACQHKNIILAEFKADGQLDHSRILTRHSSNTVPVSGYASKAHDNNISSCSYTNNASLSSGMPWWRVWFNNKFKITKMILDTENNALEYFKDFEITVENTTYTTDQIDSPSGAKTCLTNTGSVPKTTSMFISCDEPIIGNQIRIKLTSVQTQLVLCDVRVYGECQDGTYGESCTESCSPHCDGICDKDSGECHSCEAGWSGGRCNQCSDDRYGLNCENTCSSFCKRSLCNKLNGNCDCIPGYIGNLCNKRCRNGTYGNGCAFNCSKHCLNGAVCLNTNGSCINGCDPGWTGETCNAACSLGYFGPTCSLKCSIHCTGGYVNCDSVYGSCLLGCNSGWKGRRCITVCRPGTWGLNCVNSCGSCDSGTCSFTDGVCNGPCSLGFKNTAHCDEVCEDGTYGKNCLHQCSQHCYDVCDNVNGHCRSCHSGWHGKTCSHACEAGRWGENCDHRCVTCHNETCDRLSGACNGLCKPGFKQTKYCDQECTSGFYGVNCSLVCSPNCKDLTSCRKTDGSCLECKDGWELPYCLKNAKRAGETGISGGEIVGISSSFVVIIVIVLLTLIIRRKVIRRHNAHKEASVSYVNTLVTDAQISDNTGNMYEDISGDRDVSSDYVFLNDDDVSQKAC